MTGEHPNIGEKPQPPWEQALREAEKLLDDYGGLDLTYVTQEQQEQLDNIEIPISFEGQSACFAPNILNVATRRVFQEPAHLLLDDDEFITASSNFYTGFINKNLYDVPKFSAHWRRFMIVAPTLYEWLQHEEAAFDKRLKSAITQRGVAWLQSEVVPSMPTREREHMEGLRLAYAIVAQLVCEGDPIVPDKRVGPGDTTIIRH